MMTARVDEASPPVDPCAAFEAASVVLLAAPDGIHRARLAWCLRKAGYTVLEVSAYAALLEELRRRTDFGRPLRPPVDLLVTSGRLPDGSGHDAVQLLRYHGWATPAIVIDPRPSAGQLAAARRLSGVSILDSLDDTEFVLDYAHYLAPRAWRRGRVRGLRRLVSEMG